MNRTLVVRALCKWFGTAAGRFDAGPLGDIFFKGHSNVAETICCGHGYSVTRNQCVGKEYEILAL